MVCGIGFACVNTTLTLVSRWAESSTLCQHGSTLKLADFINSSPSPHYFIRVLVLDDANKSTADKLP